jgi:hypothetical protein
VKRAVVDSGEIAYSNTNVVKRPLSLHDATGGDGSGIHDRLATRSVLNSVSPRNDSDDSLMQDDRQIAFGTPRTTRLKRNRGAL